MRPALAAAAVLARDGMAAVAQLTDAVCTQNKWSFNSAGQSPCAVWAQLSALCTSGMVVVPRLASPDDQYSPPSGSTDNACYCNVVAYNLASACALCQPGFTTGSLVPEDQWRLACTSYNDSGISQDHHTVQVPAWAFLPEQGGVFRAANAKQFAMDGVINPTSSTRVSASSASAQSSVESSSQTPEPARGSPKPKVHIGPVIGGVVGGVVVLAFAALLIARYRSYMRSKPALSPPREIKQKEYGIPSDLKIQHFVPQPPSSGHTSDDNLPHRGAALHPYAASYAIQRNMPEPRTYTSSSNYSNIADPHSILPFDTRSITPGKSSPAPFSSSYNYGPGAHPYASPLVDDEYDRTLPEAPLPRELSPWAEMAAAQEIPTQMPTRPLPPLRVPQPVRHSSTGTTDFSPSSYDSVTPLQRHQSSIDSRIVSSHGHSTHQHSRSQGKTAAKHVHPPSEWTIE